MRSNHLTEPLHALLTPAGAKSTLFPRDLATLFGASHTTARALLREYALPLREDEETPKSARRSRSREGGESRERMLNRFMSHIGVRGALLFLPPAPTLTSSPFAGRVPDDARASEPRAQPTSAYRAVLSLGAGRCP